MSARSNQAAVVQTTNNHVASIGIGFRGPGLNSNSNLGTVGQELKTTVTGHPDEFAEQVLFIDDDLQNLPLGPGFDVGQFRKQVEHPKWDDAANALGLVTGVNVQQLTQQFASKRSVEAKVNEFMDEIKRQVISEIKRCIEKYLRRLVNKNPEIMIILDWKGYIKRQIELKKREIRLKIERERDKVAYDKLKIQQIGQFKQKILAAIRGICPGNDASSEPPDYSVTRISPSLTKKFQSDFSWLLPDGDNDLTLLAQHSNPVDLANVENGDSTGELVIDVSDEAIKDILKDSQNQSLENEKKGIDFYINIDGTLTETAIV